MASVALSFLYVAFVRILQLLRLPRDDRDELGIEVIMLRHEVSVLSRQIVRQENVQSDLRRKSLCTRRAGTRRNSGVFGGVFDNDTDKSAPTTR